MRTKLAFGAATVVATVSLSFAVNGLATSQLSGGLLEPPAAAAEELAPFADCDELLQWYVDQALPEVGPYGLGGGVWAAYDVISSARRDLALPRGAVAEGSTSKTVQNSDSGTNVQEVGVDEPDRAKTDGDRVVHLRGRTLVVTDVRGAAAEEVGTLRLPRGMRSAELLLSGDTALVLGTPSPGYPGWGPIAMQGSMVDRALPALPPTGNSRLLEVSLADPTDPEVTSDQTFGGSLVSARQYDDTVRLVLRTGSPTLDFVLPNRDRTEKEAKRENRRIVRDSEIGDWLPSLRVDDGDREPLLDCADVRHPETGAGFGTLSIVTLPAAEPTDLDATAVTAAGETVYSSTDRLYLATRGKRNTTEVHAFALDGRTTTYVASGEVDGTVRDRWSMDEQDGVLRVAVAHGNEWSPKDNGVTTLRERDGDLEVLGSVRGLGPREQIKSVRWFDELAIVVTFRQTDPLYTVALADPAEPRTLGELKIPGFSEYLHPIGDDLLLGLGEHATMRGETRGGQVSLFDVEDLASPRRVATLGLGRQAQAAASHDPRAFTWLADRDTALIAVDQTWNGRAAVLEIKVSDDGELTEGRQWPLPRWGGSKGRALPLPTGAVAVVGSSVQLVELD